MEESGKKATSFGQRDIADFIRYPRLTFAIGTIIACLGGYFWLFKDQNFGIFIFFPGFLIMMVPIIIFTEQSEKLYEKNLVSIFRTLGWERFTIDEQSKEAKKIMSLPNYIFQFRYGFRGDYHNSSITFVIGTIQNFWGDEKTVRSISLIQHELSSPFDGTLMVASKNTNIILPDINFQTEAREFNLRFSVYANPQRVATPMLSPDFMAWLLDQHNPLLIIVHDHTCSVLFEEKVNPQAIPERLDTMGMVIHQYESFA